MGMVQAVVEETVKIKIQPLTAAAFQPYGKVLERGELIYPESEEGRVAMELLRTKHRPNGRRTEQLAVHFTYNQTFIPVQGSMALIVAPPPTDREADPSTYDFDYDQTAAFLVEPGQVAFIEKGVWHNAVSMGAECTFINVTRKNAREGTTDENLDGRIERVSAKRPYVGFIDLKKRYNRILELEL
jgi:ureidoglycolate hydrolase